MIVSDSTCDTGHQNSGSRRERHNLGLKVKSSFFQMQYGEYINLQFCFKKGKSKLGQSKQSNRNVSKNRQTLL